jgi:alpha-beta hydrolase superfamily lysophospholipase
MTETACQFGDAERLAGIVTEPDAGRPELGLVLVSAGLLPKAGPFRLYAELARHLAKEGVVTLRFDLGGVGDSIEERAGRPLRERTALEIRAAVDYLSERYALPRLVLGGLCSGAEDALRSAAADGRVSGVVMIDPFAYRSAGWHRRHVRHRLVRRALRAVGLYRPIATSSSSRVVHYKYMDREEASATLKRLLHRDAYVHFLYTAGVREHLNHRAQVQAWFPELDFGDRVTVDHFPHLDHTQLLAEDRRTLVRAIAARLRAEAEPPSAPEPLALTLVEPVLSPAE